MNEARDPTDARIQRLDARQRLAGLTPGVAQLVQQAARDVDLRQFDLAERNLADALRAAPAHPEVQRIHGVLCHRRGRPQEALAALGRTLASWPDDALALGNIGSVLADHGNPDGALERFRRASEVAPGFAVAWFNLGKALEMQAFTAEARDALQCALTLAPEHVPARILYAETLNMCGDARAAAAEFRRAIAIAPMAARAWVGLANLKTEPLTATDIDALLRLRGQRGLSDDDRAIAGFALGKAFDDNARHDEAFDAFVAANALKRRLLPWDAAAFSAGIDAVDAAFARPHARAPDAQLGGEVIFIVGLPRSGSTLVEQILGAHAQVEGAGELPDLEFVLAEESRYRGEPFPAWVARATPADWSRLGERYLQRTARWRTQRPRCTDKRPENWMLIGAARAMLPGARIIDCRRDALETCWSCFKQLFGPGRLAPMYDLDDIASYWRDHDRLCEAWLGDADMHAFRVQRYEALVADAEAEIRALLNFCGLPFEPACLAPHESARPVRSVSAAQVREPLRGGASRATPYGERLAGLRAALANPAPADGDID